jgi:ATP-binding cassette subfamily F protein uup
VRTLSGGERNRLLLARLFARPANLLVMDEPTNDLDLESIELLETTLQSYPGTLILVSHDRTFLDNVVTSVLVARGGGDWLELVGGYTEWLAARAADAEMRDTAPSNAAPVGRSAASSSAQGATADDAGRSTAATGTGAATASRRGSLTYKESREFAELPARIEALEEGQKRAQEQMSRPDFFKRSADEIRAHQAALEATEAELTAAMTRWEQLMEKEAGGA